MGHRLHIAAALIATMIAGPAHGEEPATPVRVEVTWIETEAEMNAKRREYGAVRPDSVIKTTLTGFSVLGRRDGELVCLIFAPKPRTEDDKPTLILGHELAHCLLGN